ncbi:MAG: NUDIX domain-containing protein [Rhodocyclaceae bacterium]
MSRERFQLSVSVFMLVRDDRRVLLLRRANTGWKDGFFSLPAGAHDGGETLAEAAARELREETGLQANAQDMELAHLMHCHSGDAGGEWMGAFFLASRWTGVPRITEQDKHDQLDWFSIDALPGNTIPYTRQGITLALQGVPYSTHGWSDITQGA